MHAIGMLAVCALASEDPQPVSWPHRVSMDDPYLRTSWEPLSSAERQAKFVDSLPQLGIHCPKVAVRSKFYETANMEARTCFAPLERQQ